MTQTVTLEDGSVHNFPDDATPEEMNAALPSPPEPMGAVQDFENAATKGYNNLGLGLLNAGTNVAQSIGAIDPDTAKNYQQDMSSYKQSLGNVYPTQPGISEWIGKTLGENAPALLVPGGPLAAGAAFGATSALSSEDPGINGPQQALDVAKNAAEYGLSSKAGDMALSGLMTVGGKAYNMAKGVVSHIVQAYNDAGITPRLVGDVTGSPSMQLIQGMASKLPLGAGQIEDAASKTLNEFGNSVENTAAQLGKSTTLQEAGNALQDYGQKWLDGFKNQSDKLHGLVNDAVGAQTPVPLTNTTQLFNTLKQTSNDNPEIENFLSSPLMKQFGRIVDTSPDQGIPWETSRALKTRVGQYLENPALIADAGASQAKQLYSVLSLDQRAAIPQDALPLFDQANQFTSQGHDFINNVLGNVMKQDPEQAAQSLLQSGVRGGTQLQALRQQMPDAADELASASIRRLGAGTSQGGAGNAVSPSRWLSNQDPVRRLSPEARDALFSDPSVQSKMNALDTVAGSMRASEKFANQSGTGGHLGTMMALSAPVEGAIAGGAAGGSHGAIIGGLAGSVPIGLGGGSGLISTSPALARFLSTPTPVSPIRFAPSLTSAFPSVGHAKGGLITNEITHSQFVDFIKNHGKKMGYTLKDKSDPTAVGYAIHWVKKNEKKSGKG